MIKGLPKTLSTSILEEFVIGHQEAIRDELLKECFCDIAPVRRFLRGDKDFLLGVKGAGKSAIFKQLITKRIAFQNPKELHQILVPIDQDIDYLGVKSHLSTALESAVVDEDIRMRFVWEIYILYRMIVTLVESSIVIDDEDMAVINPMQEYFSFENKKPSILELITRANRTIGCKLDISHTGFPVPDFYIKSEPNQIVQAPKTDVRTVFLNLAEIQSKVNSILRRNNAVIYVLIDNLDDFLAREAYDAQRMVIQGLISCVKDYSRHTYIFIKAFLRNEVFHKVDFEKLGGAEKIKPNAVDLIWEDRDIRRFLAERLLYNIHKLLGIDKFSISIEEGDLRKRPFVTRLLPRKLLKLFGIDEHEALDVTERDFMCRQIITTFMPREVQHFDASGNPINGLDLFEYTQTHFCLANSRATPRAILIYLDKLLQVSDAYYADRLYPEIELNEEGEYPLFLRQHVLEAYGMLQKDMVAYISSAVTHPEWKERITSLLSNIGRKTEFKFRELRKLIDYDEQDQDAKELLAFLEHLGVLVCENKSVHLPDRKYHVPVLLQKNWVEEKGVGL